MKELLYYLIFINVFTFLIFGLDKYRAIKKMYRIKEKTLFGLSLIGGSIGAYIGMNTFRHKTLKNSFRYGIPFLIIIDILIILWIIKG